MKKKPANATLAVRGTEISVIRHGDEDYISQTDIAKSKNADHPDDLIRNWLRNRNTLELLGIWEQIHNPEFNPVEFDGFIEDEELANDSVIKESLTTAAAGKAFKTKLYNLDLVLANSHLTEDKVDTLNCLVVIIAAFSPNGKHAFPAVTATLRPGARQVARPGGSLRRAPVSGRAGRTATSHSPDRLQSATGCTLFGR